MAAELGFLEAFSQGFWMQPVEHVMLVYILIENFCYRYVPSALVVPPEAKGMPGMGRFWANFKG